MPRVSIFLLPLLIACVDDVGAGKVTAELVSAKPAAAAEVSGRSVAIDPARSSIAALGAKVTATHPIAFDRWEGSLQLDGAALTGLAVTVHMDSLRADQPKLTGHLQSADFFDVARFPHATFRSSSVVAKAGADGATHEVTGELSMHGVSKQVRFPARVTAADQRVELHTEFAIDRQDFGIAYPGRPDDLIQDAVVLTVTLASEPDRA